MRHRITAALVVVVLLIAGCSDDGGGSDQAADRDATTTTEAAAAPAVEQYEGSLEDFYVVPDPLPPGEPGELIRTMAIEAPAGQTGLRIMYHSTDAEGDDRAVTGTVYYPDADAPEDGWPILAWAHGTSGLAPACAPSRSPSPPPAYGVTGVLVSTDYIGLGPVGELHPYLSAAAEGDAVVDSVAAVRNVPDAHAGDRWALAGVSQGGHAVLVTSEMAADRLPDAELVGAVALAPGSELSKTYGDDLQARIITTLALVGFAAEDPDIDLATYLSPPILEAAKVIEEDCIAEITSTMAAVATTPGYFKVDPRTDAAGQAWLEQNDPGQVASDSPLLVVQGGQDILVLPPRTAALMERLCSVGQVVERLDIPTAGHDTIVDLASEPVSAWIAARFAGDPPADSC